MLAGFLPPIGNQIWNTKLLWQPIPVHTEPLIDLVSIPQINDEYKQSDAKLMKNFTKDVKFLSSKTGVKISDWHNFVTLVDNLICRVCFYILLM